MKEKLLSILGELEQHNLEDYCYSLTIDYEDIVKEHAYSRFDVHDIINKLSEFNDFESYNLCISNNGPYDEDRYKKYYFNVHLIFYSKGLALDFSSPYLINLYIQPSSIEGLFNIYNEHKECSKRLYDVIKLNSMSKQI